MSLLKLEPACKKYFWGGCRLIDEYGKRDMGDMLGETWELSCHSDGYCVIANGVYAGKTLQQYIEEHGKKVLGTNCSRFWKFPILIKFIDSREGLSVQVHPDDSYALKEEGQYGKTEVCYVMDAGIDSFFYYGFKTKITKKEFQQRIEDNTLLDVLNVVPVKKGDVLFIAPGTIHAIGKNILLAEIQQNSDVTYRVYDYDRVNEDGTKRDLHIDKALDVTKCVPVVSSRGSYPHVADCDYFTVDKLNLDGTTLKKVEGFVSEKSFVSVLFLDGEGSICNKGEKVSFRKGDSFFLCAGSGTFHIEGSCDALITTIAPERFPDKGHGIYDEKGECKY